jgi:hypothetical protein
MSSTSPDPAPRKGRQISWLIILAAAPLLPVISFFSQRETPPPLPAPVPEPAPIVVEPEPLPAVAMRSTPFPVPTLKKHYEPLGETAFDDDQQDDHSPDPAHDSGVNASTHYRNAFLLYAALTEEEKKLLHQPARQVPARNAAELFKKIGPIVELLRKAQNANFCQWGVTEPTYDKPLPHVARALDLGVAAVWSADYRFAKEPEEALADLRAQARLGDSLADTLAGWQMQRQLETLAMSMVRQHTGHFTWDIANAAQDILQSSSLPNNIWRAFQGELKAADALAQSLNSGSREEQTRSLAVIQAMVQSLAGRKVDAALEKLMIDGAWLLPEWRYTQTLMLQMAEQMPTSAEEYEEWWASVQKTQLSKEHPLSAMMLKGLQTMRPQWEEHQLQRAMLCTGLYLFGNEAGKTVKYNDPANGWDYAFTHVKKAGGFELRSVKKVNGKPLTMSFERRRENN